MFYFLILICFSNQNLSETFDIFIIINNCFYLISGNMREKIKLIINLMIYIVIRSNLLIGLQKMIE